MEKDVREIFEKLSAPDGFRRLINSLYTNIVEKIFLAGTGLAIIGFIIVYLIPSSRPYSKWLLFCTFLSILFYLFASFLGKLRYIFTPIKAYVSDLAQKIDSERKIVKDISQYSQKSINAAKVRLEFEQNLLSSRMGFLLGIMDKLGIIPAFIGLYLSYAKIMNDPTLKQVPEYLLAFLAGTYLGAFFAKAISEKLSLMVVLLQQALELSEEKKILGQTKSNNYFIKTLLYSVFKKRIDDAVKVLIQKQITPWSFLNSGRLFRIKEFDGQEIVYDGVDFNGSPRNVFWCQYIDPFLEALIIQEITASVPLACKNNVDPRPLLLELQELLIIASKKVFSEMADVDRRLLGKGFPETVPLRSVDKEVQRITEFIEEHVQCELRTWGIRRKLEEWYKRNKFLVWLTGILVAIAGLCVKFF